MSAIYTSYAIEPGDSIEKRQEKLYLAVISMGELLYQKGATVTEMNKEFMRMEVEIANMRRELRAIRELISQGDRQGE